MKKLRAIFCPEAACELFSVSCRRPEGEFRLRTVGGLSFFARYEIMGRR